MLLNPDIRDPVTWLASYPRSGNTLLRTLLKRCFNLNSHSIYSDQEFPDPVLQWLVGEEPVGDNPHQFVAEALREGRNLFVKTHELPPPDHHPAIYVMRDGRSAVVSHTHYLRDHFGHDLSFADVIAGRMGTTWSQHVQAWMGRPRTLVLRYENLAAGDPNDLAAISAFIGVAQANEFDVSFRRLQGLWPAFFRRGSDQANISELDPESAQLFERLHGETLRAVGYGVGDGMPLEVDERRAPVRDC